MNQVEQKFDLWALVELFGYTKIAGKCTEQNIAGTNMLRVDVPETKEQPAFTRFFGSAAIYAINPVDESTARFYAERLEQKPIQAWDVKEMLQKNNKLLLAIVNNKPEPELEFEQDHNF
jgi:hypothetical protein